MSLNSNQQSSSQHHVVARALINDKHRGKHEELKAHLNINKYSVLDFST